MAKLTQDWTYRTPLKTAHYKAGATLTGDAFEAAKSDGVVEQTKGQDDGDTGEPAKAGKARTARKSKS